MFVSFSSHSWQWHSKVSFNCDSLRTEKRAHKTETLAVSAFNFMTNRLSCWHNFQRVINRFFAVFLASNQAILNELTIRNFCGRWQNAIQIKCIRFLKLCKFEMRVCVWASARAWCGIMQIALLMYSESMSTNNRALDSHHFCRNHSGGSIALKNFIFACKRLQFFFTYLFT